MALVLFYDTNGVPQPVDVTDGSVHILFTDEDGVSYGVKQIDGKMRVSSMPYLYDVAEGNVSGHESWTKIGYNGDVDVGTEDMIAQGGTYVFPAAAIQMDIVSSSAEDDPAKADTNMSSVLFGK